MPRPPTDLNTADARDTAGAAPSDILLGRRASTSSSTSGLSTLSSASDASLTTAESTSASFQTASIGHGIALDAPVVAGRVLQYEPVPGGSRGGREELAGEAEAEHDAEMLATPRQGFTSLATPTPRHAAEVPAPPPVPDASTSTSSFGAFGAPYDEAAFAAYAASLGRPLTRSLTLEEAERATRTLAQEKDAFASTEGSAFSSSGHSSGHAPPASLSSSSHAPPPDAQHAQHTQHAQSAQPPASKARAPLQALFAADHPPSEPYDPLTRHSPYDRHSPHAPYAASSSRIDDPPIPPHGPGAGMSHDNSTATAVSMAALGTMNGNSTRTFTVRTEDEPGAAAEKAALADEDKHTLALRRAAADVEDPGPGPGFGSALLLNLPPPPPFDLRVEALTVGVPVVRCGRIAR